jgi:hypothetical protein
MIGRDALLAVEDYIAWHDDCRFDPDGPHAGYDRNAGRGLEAMERGATGLWPAGGVAGRASGAPARHVLAVAYGRLQVEKASAVALGGRQAVLTQVGFALEAGEVLGVIGPTA